MPDDDFWHGWLIGMLLSVALWIGAALTLALVF